MHIKQFTLYKAKKGETIYLAISSTLFKKVEAGTVSSATFKVSPKNIKEYPDGLVTLSIELPGTKGAEKLSFLKLCREIRMCMKMYVKTRDPAMFLKTHQLAWSAFSIHNTKEVRPYNLEDIVKATKLSNPKIFYKMLTNSVLTTNKGTRKNVHECADRTLNNSVSNIREYWNCAYGFDAELNEALEEELSIYTTELKIRSIGKQRKTSNG